jgi:hypothetical protein
MNNKIQHFFWLTRSSINTNTLFFVFNQEQLMMDNSFIKNLKSKEIYSNQQIDSFEIEKVDLLDENNNLIINSTTGSRTKKDSKLRGNSYAKTKNLDDQETISSTNGRVVLSNLAQLPDIARGLKMVQIIDKSPTPGRFAYRITFKFRDPTIEFLKTITSQFSTSLDGLQRVHKELDILRTSETTPLDIEELYLKALDSSKTAIAKANQILSLLPNKNYDANQFVSYLINLANPKASNNDRETFIKILRTLEQTLFGLLRNAGARISEVDDIGSTTQNKRSSSNKSKGLLTVVIQSQDFYNSNSTGIDFLSMGDVNLSDNSLAVVYDQNFMESRSELEFKKFWNSDKIQQLGTMETLLKQRTKTTFTPSKVYGVDQTINFDKPESYGKIFEQKIKAVKLAKDGKASDSSDLYSILDSIDGLPTSFEIMPAEHDFLTIPSQSPEIAKLSESFLQNQTNFSQDNLDTVKNKTKQVQTYDSYNDKIITTVESSFVEGLVSITENTIASTIKANTTLEQAVDQAGLAQLPPSMQAYKYRDLEASRFYEFVRVLGPLSDNSNQIYLKNYFGLVCKIQCAYFGNGVTPTLEWRDYEPNVDKTSEVLFCKFVPVEDHKLRLEHNLKQAEIFNQYFVMETNAPRSKLRQNPANLKPISMLMPESLSKSENAIGNRIKSIMNQNTTYITGVPVSYTKIIR